MRRPLLLLVSLLQMWANERQRRRRAGLVLLIRASEALSFGRFNQTRPRLARTSGERYKAKAPNSIKHPAGFDVIQGTGLHPDTLARLYTYCKPHLRRGSRSLSLPGSRQCSQKSLTRFLMVSALLVC
jgi:hypothetical protein